MNYPFTETTKNDINHKFIYRTPYIENFITNVFPEWKQDTFAVFDNISNNNDCEIAIDLGAWIGTMSIFLAKKFKHVIAIECDKESLFDLENNLILNDISNVTIIDRPISNLSTEVIIGPRCVNGWNELNLSTSCIKKNRTTRHDYMVKSITFKNMIYDYYIKNKCICNYKINFIKCDIEGAEEYILEEILHYGLQNNIKSYISFHLDWWDDGSNLHKLSKYISQYDCFVSDKLVLDAIQHVLENPHCSILFVPKKNVIVPLKNNTTICIISYNNYTYTKNMVNQISHYTKDIVVINNNSTYNKIIDYFNKEYQFTLLNMEDNHGSNVYKRPDIKKLLGSVFILTDPDLELNSNLPTNFIEILFELQNKYKCHKIGFALDISSNDIRTDIKFAGHTIKKWEAQFWTKKIANDKYELYKADVATTFCLVNFNYNGQDIRIAGDFTCKHLPWYNNYRTIIGEDDYKNYLINNKTSNWIK